MQYFCVRRVCGLERNLAFLMRSFEEERCCCSSDKSSIATIPKQATTTSAPEETRSAKSGAQTDSQLLYRQDDGRFLV